MREFCDDELTVPIAEDSLGPRAAEGGTRRQQQAKILIGIGVVSHPSGGQKEAWQIENGRNANSVSRGQEGTSCPCRKAQSALPDFVIDQ